MPISHENYNIDKINHGGAPDIIWCAKMIMRLKIDYNDTQRNVFLNLIRDLGIDPNNNPNLFAIDFGDGFGVQYMNTLNTDYEFRNNIKDTYNITLYSNDDKILYYPVDTYKDDIHFKVDNIKFNYNPEVKPVKNYTARYKSNKNRIDPIQNGIIPHNAEDVYVVYHNSDIVFGSKIDADELIYEIEIIDPNAPIRLINPLSHPRFSWERLKHNVEIIWGDGYVTKLYDYYINSGRFNRFSSIIPQHKYENSKVGQKFIIKIKSKEPLTPINCKLLKIDGSFPTDNYLVKNSKFGNDIVGLFGDCNHEDYPEIKLLVTHRNTVHTIGVNVLKNYLNTSMKNHFKDFKKLSKIEKGFFDSLLEHCVDYSSCFENNISLVNKPKELIGYINNTVINIDNMFKNTPLLIDSLQMRKSTSLITCNGIYSNSGIIKLYDDFLYECGNLKYGNEICYNATKLESISVDQFKYSNKLEEMKNGFMNTKIGIPFYLKEKRKLWNINSLFRNIKTLHQLNVDMFTNMGLEADHDVDINNLFKDSGIPNGCIVPNEFFSSLKNVKSFLTTIESIMENFSMKGSDFPSQIFNGVFHINKSKSYKLINLFKGLKFSEPNVEFRNKIFVGDNSKLIALNNCLEDLKNNIAYIKKDLLNELPNLQELNYYFKNCKLDCILSEEFLSNQRKLISAIGMFELVSYKYNHFPVDYLIRTDELHIDLTNFFKSSNIKTNKLIHWSSNKSLSVNGTNLVDVNTQVVPLSFIVDNRTLNPDISIPYNKSSIKFLTIVNQNGSVTFEGINPTEDVTIDWGDGTTSICNNSNRILKHTYNSKGVYYIKYKSKYAIIPTNRDNSNFMEIKGEFPFNSIRNEDLSRLELGSPGYMDSIMHIANMEYTNKFKYIPTYINPYYLKYGVNLKRIDLFSNNNIYHNLTVIPSKFYINCVGLEDWTNILNIPTRMIPDDLFPEKLINANYQKNNLWIGKLQDGRVFRTKHIISDILFKSYMNDDLCPFATSWRTSVKGTSFKTFKTQVNDPLDEYLGFIINKSTTNLGLKRLIQNSDSIGEIKIEIFSSEVQVDKIINITSDDQLTNCIGNIEIDPNIGFAYIRVYSKIPLWITNTSIITELRGIIPPCILETPMQQLAPNLEWYSETLLSRLENTSFKGFMANLPHLRYIHRGTFSRNIKASIFESCFENDISLLEVPDYLINSKEYDINCIKMFNGCVNVKYVYKPIDDSIRGRINVTDMFKGVKTIAFNSSDIDSQVFNRLWYIGKSNLGQHNSSIQRPTIELPTVCGWTNGYTYNQDSFTNSVYFEGSEITTILSSKDYPADILKYSQSRMIHISNGDNLPKSTLQVNDYIEKLKYLPNIFKLNFKDEHWFFDDSKNHKVYQSFNSKLFMYNENLQEVRNAFSRSEIITPINSMFMKFNPILNSLNGFAKYTWIRHKLDRGLSGVLGYDSLGYAFLGGEGIRIPLNLTSFLNSDLECLVDIRELFYTSRLNLETDTFSLGFMYPQLLDKAFGWDISIKPERDRGIQVSNKLIQNIYSHNSNLEIAKQIHQYASINSLFDGNKHNLTGTILPDRITTKTIIMVNGLQNLFRNSFIAIPNYNVSFLDNSSLLDPVNIDGMFENTNINKLPILPKRIDSMKKVFKDCNQIVDKIPKNYINGEYIDATNAFSGSSVIITDKITTAKSMIVEDMLTECISTIPENNIFNSWSGASRVITPDKRYAINNQNVFVQTIDLYPITSLYNIESLTSITEKDKNTPFKVDFGDGVIKTVTLDDFEHHYKESGVYTIIFYLDNVDFVPFIPSVRTLSISRLPKSDVTQYIDKTFCLSSSFGTYIESIEDHFFQNLTGLDKITALQLCRDLNHLKVDPIAINDKMTSLIDLSNYYTSVQCKNINDIPINIKHQIINMDLFAFESNINITEEYIKDFTNVQTMNLFGYKAQGYITPKLIMNKSKLQNIRGILIESNIEITSEYNDFFIGTNLEDAYMCFQKCKIKEFPTNIIKNTKLKNIDRLFAYGTIDDNPFILNEDFLPESIESAKDCFTNRSALIDYNSNIFLNKEKLVNVDGMFSYTGIKHIKKYTISTQSKTFIASRLFAYTNPIMIDDDLVIKWDSRYLDITSILDGVIFNKPFDQIIGRAIKYICNKNTYEYHKPQYEFTIHIDKPTVIHLINTTDIHFPMNLDMQIDFGDGSTTQVKYINSIDELRYKTKHEYKNKGVYIIKISGLSLIQLEVEK